MNSASTVSPARTCVVVCYYTGQDVKHLHRLLDQFRRVPAGVPFDLMIVVNGGDERPLTLPERFAPLRPRIENRVNRGYNIEGWDVGWRLAPGYDYYLFLQAECLLKRPNWLAEFEFRAANDPGVGLIGETIMWDRQSWEFIRTATDRDLGAHAWPAGEPDHSLDTYQRLIAARGVPPGAVGTHLPSIILFAPRAVLEAVGGFPLIGTTYREAVACEIATSRLIEAHGYRVVTIRGEAFHFIGHRQWRRDHVARMLWMARVRALGARFGARRLKRWLKRGR